MLYSNIGNSTQLWTLNSIHFAQVFGKYLEYFNDLSVEISISCKDLKPNKDNKKHKLILI